MLKPSFLEKVGALSCSSGAILKFKENLDVLRRYLPWFALQDIKHDISGFDPFDCQSGHFFSDDYVSLTLLRRQKQVGRLAIYPKPFEGAVMELVLSHLTLKSYPLEAILGR